jgi:uncharacterized protein YndB with AHSA1/START domain
MPAYTDETEIHAPAADVFRYVADVKNLSKYLPTVHHAEPHGGGKVQVEGTANDHDYKSEGWLKADEAAKTVTWGSDGQTEYNGKMTVSGDARRAKIAITINYTPPPQVAKAMEDHQGGPGEAMRDGIRTALLNIAKQCEGEGGKEPSSAER